MKRFFFLLPLLLLLAFSTPCAAAQSEAGGQGVQGGQTAHITQSEQTKQTKQDEPTQQSGSVTEQSAPPEQGNSQSGQSGSAAEQGTPPEPSASQTEQSTSQTEQSTSQTEQSTSQTEQSTSQTEQSAPTEQGNSQTAEDGFGAALEQQMDASGANELYNNTPDGAKELLGEMGVEQLDYKALLSLTPADFFKTVWGLICETARRPLVILAAITGVAVLCSMVDGLKTSLGGAGLDTVFGVVAVLCVCTVVIAPVVDCVTLAAEAIKSCSDFILSFIPVFISLVAVGGQPVSATTYNGMMLFISQVISTITTSALVPLICIYLALCLVGALTPDNNLEGAAKTAKSVVTWSLGLLVTVFVGLLGLQSLVAAGADSVTMKAGKFLVSSFVPVVGKALSDALSTAQGCVRLLKTTVGAYAILAAVLNFLPALIKTAVWYCATGLGSAVCDVLGAQRISKVLRACGSALSLLLGIIAFVALLFIVSTTVMLVTGTGAGV